MTNKKQENLITDVDGIQVGHAHDEKVATGVSVVIPSTPAVAAADVRGGGPGTRETDACLPENLVDEVHAIVLAGGSSYGLEAASTVTNWLGKNGKGYYVSGSPRVAPVVPAAILFDLMNGGDKEWGDTSPYSQLGLQACENASGNAFALGNVGAGYGAIAGQYKGGLGSTSVIQDEIQVGAMVAVNSFGSPVMPGTDRFWAWPYEVKNEFGGLGAPSEVPATSDPFAGTKADGQPGTNTTIGVVATNVALTPAQAKRIAIMAHDGLANAIHPIHTPMDGDSLFVLSTGKVELSEPDYLSLAKIGALGATCVSRAVARGVYEAESLMKIQSYKDQH